MDLTPLIPSGRQIVESYGEGRFRVTSQLYESPILVFPERTLAWPVLRFADASLDNLEPVLAAGREGNVELLLFGQGSQSWHEDSSYRQSFRSSLSLAH